MSGEGNFIAVGPDWYILTGGELRPDGLVTFPEAVEPGMITHLIAPSGFMIPVDEDRSSYRKLFEEEDA